MIEVTLDSQSKPMAAALHQEGTMLLVVIKDFCFIKGNRDQHLVGITLLRQVSQGSVMMALKD